MITTTRLVNVFCESNFRFVCVCVLRTLRIYPLSISQVYSLVLLTTVTTLYEGPQNLFIFFLKFHLSIFLASPLIL